jgi:PKHD-type hydroxylase
MWFLKSDQVEKWCWQQVFSKEECEKIINICEKIGTKDGEIDKGIKNESIRKSKILFVPTNDDTRWIFERMCGHVNYVNEKYFNYDLVGIVELQYTKYDETGFYEKHIDTLYDSFGIRKLSLSVQLCEPDTYEGGDLLLYYGAKPDAAKKDQGVMTAFNSMTLHEVKPITKGKRMALVAWVIGPKFK